MRNISESWGISRRVGERFRGSDECFRGLYKAERGLKTSEAREGTEKGRRGWEGIEKSRTDNSRGGGGGAVKEDSLGLCLMCFEVKNDYQKSSLLKVYLGWYKYGRRTVFVSRGFKIPKKRLEPSSRENVCLGLLGGLAAGKTFVWIF